MPYSFDGRIRFSEIGEDGCLTLPGVLNYFQDCATFQSASIAQGVDELKTRRRAWLLASWQIVVNRYPKLGETVITSTWPYEFKGFLGFRNFTMDTPEGERLAYANSIWSYLDMEKHVPAKLTEEDMRGYVKEPKLSMDYAPRKILLLPDMKQEDRFEIRKHHLDTNHHVNNGQYVSLAMNYLPEDFVIRQIRVEYKKQVFLGDLLCPETYVCADEGNGADGEASGRKRRLLVSFNDEKGNPCTLIEFAEK